MALIEVNNSRNLYDMVSRENQLHIKKLKERSEASIIRSWLNHQPHLPKISDEQILLFLHSCYYSVEKTKQTIDNYYTFRTHAPELYSQRDYQNDLAFALKIVHIAPVPHEHKTPEGYNMVYIRLREYNPADFDFNTSIKALLAMLDLQIATNPMSEGLFVIFDMKNLQLAHVLKFSLTTVKRFMMYMQEAIPLRLKGIHILNTISLINNILFLVKPLMKKEIWDILHFHETSQFDDFTKKYIPKTLLASDYGGDLKSVETYHTELCENLEKASCWLKDMENIKVDESKRGLAKQGSDIYGIAGSFKKLDLD